MVGRRIVLISSTGNLREFKSEDFSLVRLVYHPVYP
jgi:hypothetical protein